MFGGPVSYPKNPRRKPTVNENDISMPSVHPGLYAHWGKEPNSDYEKRLLHYKQRLTETEDKRAGGSDKNVQAELMYIAHQNKAESRRFRAKIQLRLRQKLEAYEADVDRRREKLKILLHDEEQELIRDTVHKHQNADVNKIEDRRKQCEIVRAQKEAERLELVRQKRLQQFVARSVLLRPYIAQKRLIESKDCQLQQMRENEAKREAERELDLLWCEMVKKQNEAMLEREVQDALLKHENLMKDKAILDLQIRAKKLLEEERKAIELSNREEMQKLMERIKIQEQEDLRKKHEKALDTAEDIRQQLKVQQEFEAARKREELALENAFKQLTELELAREAAKVTNTSKRFAKETAMYREHLFELDKLRKDEEAKLDKLTQEIRLEDLRKKDAQLCKIKEAKYKLQQQVLEGRAKQLEYKKLQAEKNLEFKQKENEAMRAIMEKNRLLDAEAKRVEMEAAKQYRQDLKKQIVYNKLLREREMKEIEAKLKLGLEEEEQFKKEFEILFDVKNMTALNQTHPFRRALEQFDCHCPENVKEKKLV